MIIIILIPPLYVLCTPPQDLVRQAERVNFNRLLFSEIFMILIFALLIMLIMTDRIIIPLKGSIRKFS